MANSEHLELLKKGVSIWNKRRTEKVFQPDLFEANLKAEDLQGANLQRASLDKADLQEANLNQTNLQGASLRSANMRKASLKGAILRTIVYSPKSGSTNAAEHTDLGTALNLSQAQIDEANGDNGVILPSNLVRPSHWLVVDLPLRHPNYQPPEETAEEKSKQPEKEDPSRSDESARGPLPSPVRYTPPTEFRTEKKKLRIEHLPKRAEPREASQTPIDQAKCEKVRQALLQQTRTLRRALSSYEKEDSNRAENAAQVALICDDLIRALAAQPDDFLPTLMEDYVEAIAIGYGEDIFAFEAVDRGQIEQLIKRARQHYACYPELLEAADPENTRFIDKDFPYTVATLSAELDEIVLGEGSREFFSDGTRTLLEAENNARVRVGVDPDKSKLARLSAIVGEMWREMKPEADRIKKLGHRTKDGIDWTAAWIETFDKVQKIWEAVKPFIGLLP